MISGVVDLQLVYTLLSRAIIGNIQINIIIHSRKIFIIISTLMLYRRLSEQDYDNVKLGEYVRIVQSSLRIFRIYIRKILKEGYDERLSFNRAYITSRVVAVNEDINVNGL